MADKNKEQTAQKEAPEAVSQEEFAELKELVKEQSARIKYLEGKLAAKPEKKEAAKPQTPAETFSVGKEKFKFTVPAIILPGRGTVKTADLLKEPAVLEELVLKKSGAINKV